MAKRDIPSGSVVTTVPSKVALAVESPGSGPDDSSVMDMCSDRRAFRELPWYAQFSFYLYKLDNVSSSKGRGVDLKPWLESLPRTFNTPIHWAKKDREELLQYQHMSDAVERQEMAWKGLYEKLRVCTTSNNLKWEDFLWGCECARSRAFSGAYTGAAFNPFIYAFTLLLVTGYVGLGLGTLEQAANGAALVICVSILRDFVFPKFFRVKKYVICPFIDMCNHMSAGASAQVAFEFFTDAYSLAVGIDTKKGDELFISYGSRSNDQLLQFYGFVEKNNPHDVYIMPPLREWDIASLEKACGEPFAPGKLGKLDRAGLLGRSNNSSADDSDGDGEVSGNPFGGVVVTRSLGVDPAVIQALRALVSSAEEWQAAGEAVGNFAAQVSVENERKAKLAARTAMEMELAAKPTTLQQDEELLKRLDASRFNNVGPEEILSLQFRIEKKKLLLEAIDRLL